MFRAWWHMDMDSMMSYLLVNFGSNDTDSTYYKLTHSKGAWLCYKCWCYLSEPISRFYRAIIMAIEKLTGKAWTDIAKVSSVTASWISFIDWVDAASGNGLLNDLVSYYKLDNNVNDAHGSNNGTLNWPTYTASGKNNWAYDFDWSNDRINCNFTITPQSSITYSARIKHDGKVSEFNSIVANYNSWWSHGYDMHKWTDNKLRAYIGGFSSSTIVWSTVLSSWTWYHVALTYDHSSWTMTLYVNGSSDWSDTWTATTNAGGNVHIGRAWDYNGRYFDGVIDEVCIRTRALTATDITTLQTTFYDSFTS